MKKSFDEDTQRTFAFFSANLGKLLPHISWEEHLRYFKKTLQYQQRATDPRENDQALAQHSAPPDFWAYLQQPGIIATFHTGPYRLLSMWLMQQRIPFTLLVSADVMEEQGHANRALQRRIAGAENSHLFDMLVAEDSWVLRKAMQALQKGHFIFLYVDGNTGAGRPDAKGIPEIAFLRHRLRVRAGAATLGALAKVPIYPVLPYFDKNGMPTLQWESPIHLRGKEDRQASVRKTMQVIYHLLGQFLRRHPTQWEGWLYVHHDLVRSTNRGQASFWMHYMPFALGGRHFLLHKESYFAFPLEKQLYDKVWRKFDEDEYFSIY